MEIASLQPAMRLNAPLRRINLFVWIFSAYRSEVFGKLNTLCGNSALRQETERVRESVMNLISFNLTEVK
jgi:hypothetical protein